MLGLHLPALDHIAEFCNAVIDEFVFVLVTVANNLPEVISSALLENSVFCEFSQLADHLEFFEADFLRLNQDKLVIEIVNVLLLKPNSHFFDNIVDLKTIFRSQRPEGLEDFDC